MDLNEPGAAYPEARSAQAWVYSEADVMRETEGDNKAAVLSKCPQNKRVVVLVLLSLPWTRNASSS